MVTDSVCFTHRTDITRGNRHIYASLVRSSMEHITTYLQLSTQSRQWPCRLQHCKGAASIGTGIASALQLALLPCGN